MRKMMARRMMYLLLLTSAILVMFVGFPLLKAEAEGSGPSVQTVNKELESIIFNSTPSRASTIMSENIPTAMHTGKEYPVAITVRNDGSLSWNEGSQFRLGGVGDSDPFAIARHGIAAGQTVEPGGTYTFHFTMKAPKAAGTYTTDWRMVHENVEWFGEVIIKTVNVIDVPKASTIVSANIPIVMQAGREYPVAITVRNDGSLTWSKDQLFRLGAVGDSDPFAITRHAIAAGQTVEPGGTYTFHFTMKAPKAAGTYTTDWRMVHEFVEWFGDIVTKKIFVWEDLLYIYDSHGRLDYIQTSSGKTIDYQYDTNGNLVNIVYP